MITEFFFLLFLVMAAVGAVMVVASRNPVASLMFLVLTLFAVAGLFVLLDAHFLAAVQVIVYAGAIMVLFLFVIMLLNLGHDRSDLRGLVGRATAVVVGAGLFAGLATVVSRGSLTGMAGGMGAETVQAVLASRGAMGAVADPLFRSYLVPFEVTSLLLLVAVVGAIVLARRKAP
jgi:NADH-quinone oxidoreductase subunit J